MGVKRKRYPEEFKADAVELLRTSGESLSMVAQRLGVNRWTLRDWYRASDVTQKTRKRSPKVRSSPENESVEERTERLEKENAALHKRVRRLEEDRAILKKAAAFFARESE